MHGGADSSSNGYNYNALAKFESREGPHAEQTFPTRCAEDGERRWVNGSETHVGTTVARAQYATNSELEIGGKGKFGKAGGFGVKGRLGPDEDISPIIFDMVWRPKTIPGAPSNMRMVLRDFKRF